MAVDGTWNITMQTPLGQRSSAVTLTTSNGTLTGTQSSDGESTEIRDGSVNGDNVTWKISITSPMPLTLEFKGSVDGDAISGRVSAGFIGGWDFAGTRA